MSWCLRRLMIRVPRGSSVPRGMCDCSELLLQDACACPCGFFLHFWHLQEMPSLVCAGTELCAAMGSGGERGRLVPLQACPYQAHAFNSRAPPQQVLLSLGLGTASPHLLPGLSAARQFSAVPGVSLCREAPVPLAWRLNPVSEGLLALAAAAGVQALDECPIPCGNSAFLASFILAYFFMSFFSVSWRWRGINLLRSLKVQPSNDSY